MDAVLVKGEGFAVDASFIKADASRQRGVALCSRGAGRSGLKGDTLLGRSVCFLG